MDTQVSSPQMVFTMPQRLVVPLFQRPYVWNEDVQWSPLWRDVVRVAERRLASTGVPPQPHFLGAVVLQQAHSPVGVLQERTVIDGQQRLTTLQLLLDAVHAELQRAGAQGPAARLEALVANADAYCTVPQDQLKVWPTRHDMSAFQAVMTAPPPVDYDALDTSSLLVQAHRFFAGSARDWLAAAGAVQVPSRADALERTLSQLLQLVVINLGADENAQEIFETLNARGTPLTPADLIKNFVFQRLSEEGADVDAAYREVWAELETGFWEAEVSLGRVRQQRASLFINQWLIAQTGEEVLGREVFSTFKEYADHRAGVGVRDLLDQLGAAARVYRSLVEASTDLTGPLDREGLFAYRTAVLESEALRPLVLHLRDASRAPVPPDQYAKALDAVESWRVRRALLLLPAASYTQVVAALVSRLLKSDRTTAGDVCEVFLREQTAVGSYWPDDRELRSSLPTSDIYRRLSRSRLRMVLEALEDARRGYAGHGTGLGGQRVVRGQYAIEHVLPQRWQTHWPVPQEQAQARQAAVHTLGNLTLLTHRLNSAVSNGPWLGSGGKRAKLEEHDVLLLNRELLKQAGEVWDEASIRARGEQLVELVLQVWPAPPGHERKVARGAAASRRRVRLSDLVAAGLIEAGTVLHARATKAHGVTAVLMPDGTLDVAGASFSTPSGAGKAVLGRGVNGWRFWLLDVQTRRDLSDVLGQYYEQLGETADEALADEDGFVGADAGDDR